MDIQLSDSGDEISLEDEFLDDELDANDNNNNKLKGNTNNINIKKTINNLLHQKHIETLKFLREVLTENKELRNRIDLIQTEIEESILHKNNDRNIQTPIAPLYPFIEKFDVEIQTDPIFDESIEKINSMKKEWDIRKNEYERELNRVDNENDQLKNENESQNKQIKILNENINNFTIQITEFKREKLELNSKIENLVEDNKEILYLQQINKELNEILNKKIEIINENNIKINDLNVNIKELENDIIKIKEKSNEELNELRELCNQHDECNSVIDELKLIIKNKESDEFGKNIEIERLNFLVFQQNCEIESLKEKLKQNESNMNFKEFIAIKRELNALKQEKMNSNSNILKSNNNDSSSFTSLSLATVSQSNSPLPPLKESLIKKKPIKAFK